MRCVLLLLSVLIFSCGNTIYIVRHAEKEGQSTVTGSLMTSNPPLSEAGKVRAFVLRDEMAGKKIKHIYSTNTLRTISTAEPLSKAIDVKIELYNTKDSLNEFINQLKKIKGSALVIGHSNTVDDIVNKLMGETKIPADLKDYEYDNLFIITKKGKKYFFEKKKYGYPSNPE